MCIDYCFMGADDDESVLPILVIKDTRTKRLFSYPVPCKGVDHPFPVERMVADLQVGLQAAGAQVRWRTGHLGTES